MGLKLVLILMATLMLIAWVSMSRRPGSSAAVGPDRRGGTREVAGAAAELLSPASPEGDDSSERVLQEPVVESFEAAMLRTHGHKSALHMLQEGRRLHLEVIGRLKEVGAGEESSVPDSMKGLLEARYVGRPDEEQHPEIFARYREAEWLVQEGTLKLRREADAYRKRRRGRPLDADRGRASHRREPVVRRPDHVVERVDARRARAPRPGSSRSARSASPPAASSLRRRGRCAPRPRCRRRRRRRRRGHSCAMGMSIRIQ